MSGLLGLLILGGIFTNDLVSKSKRATSSESARKYAQIKKEDMYYDGFNNLHWTENNELLDVIRIGGVTEYRGRKTNILYKRVESEKFSENKKQERRLKEAIEYCKEHNIKYLPYYFPVNIPRHDVLCTGIEIETGKKYLCDRYMNELFSLIYLEDEPHSYSCEYGKFKEYDAIHDGTKEMKRVWDKALSNNEDYMSIQNVRECHSRDIKALQSTYYTKKYMITREEYKERLSEVEEFPFEPYKLFLM